MTDVKMVRNVAILGHGSCGKTTLAEALLFKAGKTNRLGKVDDGSSTMDYEPEEIKRNGEKIGRDPALFGKPFRRQVIGIAVGRRLADLDIALLDAALQIGVRQPQRDAELARQRALRDRAVLLHRVQQPEGDLVLAGQPRSGPGRFGIAQSR